MKKILNEQIAVTDANPIRARFYCYPRFTYPWHFHSEYELMYVECGHGQCLVGDSIIDFQEGDVILFGSELPHCMQSAPEYGTDEQLYVKGVNIQFEKDFMQYSFSHYIQFTSIRNLLEDAHRGISPSPSHGRNAQPNTSDTGRRPDCFNTFSLTGIGFISTETICSFTKLSAHAFFVFK